MSPTLTHQKMPANRKLKLLRALSVISALNLTLVPRIAFGQQTTAPDTTTTTTTTTVAAPSAATTTPDQEEPSMLSPFVVDASEDLSLIHI